MKARVKATGEIVEVEDCGSVFRHGALFHGYKDANGIKYLPTEIELQMDFDYWEACQDETPDSNPDYWTRLEHQYAGMAMQGLSEKYFKEYRDYCAGFGDMDEDEAKGAMKDFANAMADVCYYFAHVLVEKMKEAFKIECK